MQFRNFLRQPGRQEIFGSALGHSEDRSKRIRRIMCGLARQMALSYDWREPIHPGIEVWENPDIPSGYTYLAQFIAHDCVFTSTPTGALADIGANISSRRSSLLQLETLYGGGPDASPHAYVPEGQNHICRNRLLTGQAAVRGIKAGKCPLRDFGRTSALNRDLDSKAGLTSALISDPRNDVHAAIAQLTVLFHALHNKIAALVEEARLDRNDTAPDVRSYRTYIVARALCVHAYHKLVRHDLLPRLLHPGIVAAYAAPSAEFLDSQSLDALPSEFAHVFRFGHSMVRQNYVFNDLNSYGEDLVDMMLATSASRPWRMPLDDTWIAQWSHFFDLGSRRPNLSRRIGPSVSGGLFSAEVFGPVDETGSVGLPYRDLLSSGFVPQWSVPALAREIRAGAPWIARLSPLLSDDAQRTRKISRLACPTSGGKWDERRGYRLSRFRSAAFRLCAVRGCPRYEWAMPWGPWFLHCRGNSL